MRKKPPSLYYNEVRNNETDKPGFIITHDSILSIAEILETHIGRVEIHHLDTIYDSHAELKAHIENISPPFEIKAENKKYQRISIEIERKSYTVYCDPEFRPTAQTIEKKITADQKPKRTIFHWPIWVTSLILLVILILTSFRLAFEEFLPINTADTPLSRIKEIEESRSHFAIIISSLIAPSAMLSIQGYIEKRQNRGANIVTEKKMSKPSKLKTIITKAIYPIFLSLIATLLWELFSEDIANLASQEFSSIQTFR